MPSVDDEGANDDRGGHGEIVKVPPLKQKYNTKVKVKLGILGMLLIEYNLNTVCEQVQEHE